MVRVLMVGAVVTLGAVSLGGAPAGAAESPAPAIPTVTVDHVQLTPGAGTGAERSYEATVLDSAGRPVAGADLDLGGLAADPDLRVRTTPMRATAAEPTRYRATVSFPADGDWMLVVRVHAPSQVVDLFTETVTGMGDAPSSHDLASNPARRAVLQNDPTFYDRYNGSTVLSAGAAEGRGATDDHAGVGPATATGAGVVTGTHGSSSLEATSVALVTAHSAGALAWMVAVLGLVLANRMGPGAGRTEITGFIRRHYSLLAGGGLLLLTVTGVLTAVYASAGLTQPTTLMRSTLGTAYVAVFGLKLALVAGSVATSWRVGRVLNPASRPGSRVRVRPRLASVGAMANDDPGPRLYRLAEANALFAALIVGCVVVLGQLHHAL